MKLFSILISTEDQDNYSVHRTVRVSAQGGSNNTYPFFLFLNSITCYSALIYPTNGTCVFVAFSTVLSCTASLLLPSGPKYNVRIGSSNYFGDSPIGQNTSIIAAGKTQH